MKNSLIIKLLTPRLFLLWAVLAGPVLAGNAQGISYYIPDTSQLNPDIPTPEEFLGYPIGSHFTRHDRIVSYFEELAKHSDKIQLETIGKTYEERPLIIATISSPSNLSNLESIQQEHKKLVDPAQGVISAEDNPVVVLLGYSVHGNETSSGEAALLTAYYLVANENDETQRFLDEAVILIDPAQNPDGRDRAASWHNSYKSAFPSADPFDKEHREGWPNGRSNHYLANLNRDWLSATQVESQARLEFFHQWYPNVHIDFHEMGTGSTYYLEPSPERTESPIMPKASYDFNKVVAKYQIEELDKIGSFYFTGEVFDNLSPIYGSTYPDFHGAVGVTLEQASSRGLVQESENGDLHFAFTIRNHFVTGIGTLRAAVSEKEGLFQLQKDVFRSALDQAKAHPTKSYVFGDENDTGLTHRFLELLLSHRIEVYSLGDDLSLDGKDFKKGHAFVVPASQSQFRLIHSIFEEMTLLKDSLYYDNTAWSIIHAYGIKQAKSPSAIKATGERVNSVPDHTGEVVGGQSNYAYVLQWTDYNASKALTQLLNKGIRVKASMSPFKSSTEEGVKDFGYGSLLIPVTGQDISADELYQHLSEITADAKVNAYAVSTGWQDDSIDLGSRSFTTLSAPSVATVFGRGINYEEAGQIWQLLDRHVGLALAKLDFDDFKNVPLARYNVIILPHGVYNDWDERVVEKIKRWVNDGGTLVTFRGGAEWAIRTGISSEKLYQDTAAKADVATRVDYDKREVTEVPNRINGGIFLSDLDLSNPLAFGLAQRVNFLVKTGTTLFQPSENKYATVAKYLPEPYVSGYVSKDNIRKVSESASILAEKKGQGTIVLFADDPTYRSYWHGTDRLLINALFFGEKINL